jgi:hypothetical protein
MVSPSGPEVPSPPSSCSPASPQPSGAPVAPRSYIPELINASRSLLATRDHLATMPNRPNRHRGRSPRRGDNGQPPPRYISPRRALAEVCFPALQYLQRLNSVPTVYSKVYDALNYSEEDRYELFIDAGLTSTQATELVALLEDVLVDDYVSS